MIRTQDAFEGFAVSTAEGLIFTVKGLVHPPERLVAYLRYLPDPGGNRERAGVHYRRVYRFEEQEQILGSRYPIYLSYDPAFGVRLQSVPRSLIRAIYDPRRRLANIRERGPADPVEAHVLGLADLLQETARIPAESLGISGSVLVGLHREDSDIDIVIYGEIVCRAAHQALRRLLDDPAIPLPMQREAKRLLRGPNSEELAALHASHRPDTPLSLADFVCLQNRKVNEGRFRGREVFFRFVKRPAEAREHYGDPRFEPLGSATIQARVMDDEDAIFTPCRYVVEEATFLEGPPVADLCEIVSFRGRFSEQVRAGEWAAARGSLERVIPRSGPAHHRLVVGGRAGDYLLARRQCRRVTDPRPLQAGQ